ncbi:MAG: tetratricopeptide repeat protein [Alphaproteobacteria bacterium]|nr:tetratricopeptide repeat protein [Alphaproteobacteria bacterium]
MSVFRVFTFILYSAVFLCAYVTLGIIPAIAQGALSEVSSGTGSDADVSAQGEADPHVFEYDNAAEEAQSKNKAFNNQMFFDAEDLVPQGEMARGGPNPVNPVLQPASKLVIVKKNYEPDTKEAHLVSAERAMALGRYDSALSLFDVLYEKNKKDPRVLMGRAVVLQKLGWFEEAMGMYEELSEVAPDNLEVKINMLGLLSTRFPSIALRQLLDLHVDHKSNVGLTAQIAVCYASLGETQDAIKYLGVAASMEPANANHVFNMAVIADKAGDKKQAISYYEKALEIDTINGGGRSIPREVVYERLAQLR